MLDGHLHLLGAEGAEVDRLQDQRTPGGLGHPGLYGTRGRCRLLSLLHSSRDGCGCGGHGNSFVWSRDALGFESGRQGQAIGTAPSTTPIRFVTTLMLPCVALE